MNIEKAKNNYKNHLESYGKEIRQYIDKYGNDNSDYLIHRRLMESYHRGAFNALNELGEV